MGSFWKLFRHIKSNDIPMTAPVEMDLNERSRTTNMGFAYEHSRQGSLVHRVR